MSLPTTPLVISSVFECVLDKDKFEELKLRLRKRVKPDEDSVRFYPLTSHALDQVEIWGGPPLTAPPHSIVV
jgi:CRISPR-associated protein Cas2